MQKDLQSDIAIAIFVKTTHHIMKPPLHAIYDFHARLQIPDFGRFHRPDHFCHKTTYLSSYQPDPTWFLKKEDDKNP